VPPQANGGSGDADDDGQDRAARGRGGRQTKPGKSRKHFVEPYPYTAEQRDAITRVLADSGLGDATAREIFIGAIAYDLALLAAALAEPDATPTATPATAPTPRRRPKAAKGAPAAADAPTDAESGLAERARAFAAALSALDDAAQARLLTALTRTDPFRREYGAAYLEALATEADRLGAALAAAEPGAPGSEAEPTAEPLQATPAPATEPPPTNLAADAGLAFVRHAASVYEQCFDARPDAAADAPFAKALRAVANVTGIPIPDDESLLRRTLSRN
jgi:hypothetical protein